MGSFAQPTGDELAKEMRNLEPVENSHISGILIIRQGKVRREVPVALQTIVGKENWKVAYRTPDECLVLLKQEEKPTQYFTGCKEEKPLPSQLLTNSFAGSDFSAEDLGLQFLYWPVQKRLKGEMRLGRPCHVLESFEPKTKRRVKSWVDVESNGILIAESYDNANRLQKEFSLSGSSFKKVNGRWQLEEMKIRNARTRSETILKFDLPPD